MPAAPWEKLSWSNGPRSAGGLITAFALRVTSTPRGSYPDKALYRPKRLSGSELALPFRPFGLALPFDPVPWSARSWGKMPLTFWFKKAPAESAASRESNRERGTPW